MTRSLEEVEAGLFGQPHLLEGFRRCLRLFQSRGDAAVAVSGSLAESNVDRYSDLDFDLICPGREQVAEARRWTLAAMTGVGPLLARFPATHLGLEDLLVFFLRLGESVVKVDVWVKDLESFTRSGKSSLVWTPASWIALPEPRPEEDGPGEGIDFADLIHKFTGWAWYTYAKIARGELFEAANSLDCMRVRALLPCLQLLSGLPFEGYRRIEARLSSGELESLRRGMPGGLEKEELLRSLRAMLLQFHSVLPRVLDMCGATSDADVAGMLELIERDIRSTPGN